MTELDDIRDERDRAHDIVHACRDALATTLRTKSFAKVKALIALIDQWKARYAYAKTLGNSTASEATHVCLPLTTAAQADVQPKMEDAMVEIVDRLSVIFEKAGVPLEDIPVRIALGLAGSACGILLKTQGWNRLMWMEQMDRMWSIGEEQVRSERTSPGGQA